MKTSTMLTRNGSRQPQLRNASLDIAAETMLKATTEASTPNGAAALYQAAIQATPSRRRVLDHQQHGSAPFAAEPDALHQPQNDEQHRRGHANLLIGRQAADQEGADAHQDHGGGQHLLAAEAIAEMAEQRTAERAGEKADAVGGDRDQCAEQRRQGRKEDLVEDQVWPTCRKW